MKHAKFLLCLLLSAALLLTPILTAAAETAEDMLFGDADNDGAVTVFDATAIQRVLADLPTEDYNRLNADANNDNIITVLDATEIQRHLAELPANERIGRVWDGWVIKDSLTKEAWSYEEDLKITEIHPDYFFAIPVTPLPIIIKINGSLEDKWCVGDKVYCVCDNIWYEQDNHHMEGDLVSISESTFTPDPNVAYKPVIYLYPEQECEVNVTLDLDGELLKSEPLYHDGWTVTASPDGMLTDKNGETFDYLFWEAKLNTNYDMSRGFCVKGADTESFLTNALKQQGLNQKETADFLEFWLPILKRNPYNVIAFQKDAYTSAAGLNVSPKPDTVIRVFMTYYPSKTAVNIPAQELSAPARSGFSVVEWGGSLVG